MKSSVFILVIAGIGVACLWGFGRERPIHVETTSQSIEQDCPECGGFGSHITMQVCDKCNGSGKEARKLEVQGRTMGGSLESRPDCRACRGRGKQPIRTPCETCPGTGKMTRTESARVKRVMEAYSLWERVLARCFIIPPENPKPYMSWKGRVPLVTAYLDARAGSGAWQILETPAFEQQGDEWHATFRIRVTSRSGVSRERDAAFRVKNREVLASRLQE